ncbi:uncharacterized protein E0L32_012177 [Thyridium curvatum]|uniref:Probable dipeptidyl-aminopeptidase B n=1 Tax=Thyridium curvatum TaxID=1093900 RepID=A0A507BL09_9PEZI|nr:uncharacterized protein E0L32_012177 [Thyridium curvatum]TPX17348.1 hypothetical protein E0L32_012177 [Thyridium curvatum]
MKLAIKALAAALFACLAAAIALERQPHQPLDGGDKLLTFNNTVLQPQFTPKSQSVQWLAGGKDGQYVYESNGSLVLQDIVTSANKTLAKLPDDQHEYWISPDLSRVLVATNYTKQYRHSYFSNYVILDVASGESTPLVGDQAGDIQYAELAPAGNAVAFVRGNDLFLDKNGTVSRITSDGNPDLFHAVPDWVYEEEIFGDRKTLWFSPDGKYIAFLSFNETGVETYTVEYYMNKQEVAPVYPRKLDLRYPKVGTTNPTVSLSILDVETEQLSSVAIDAFTANDLIVGEVAWVTKGHDSLIYRAFNRVQDHDKHVRVDVPSGASTVVRERDGTDGWLDNSLAIRYVGSAQEAGNDSHYIDLSDESGWQHIYLHSVNGGEPKALTSGEWEVLGITKVDTARKLVYFTSTEHHSTESHLYSVSYATGEKKALVDDTVAGSWSASFSAGGSYYILSYNGPDVPYQELYSVNSTSTPVRTVTDNKDLYTALQEYNLPNITYFELQHPEGYSLNVMQRLPVNFDPAEKYPVLLTPYGGPGAQEVTKRFQRPNWNGYIASDPELRFITLTVDNRGTGNKGRAFRSVVAKRLGVLEAQDQLWAARELASRHAFVDAAKIGIWGWSYGGFLSAKVLEANAAAGDVVSHALITAPVSDWRFYDSMYTERYMKTPAANAGGYEASAVRRADGFRAARGGFSIMHGLGDDNVHYQNTAALVDLLVGAGVPPAKLNWLAFTDSDHGISYHGATAYLYKHLTARLYQERQRVEGGELTHQWSRRRAGPRL